MVIREERGDTTSGHRGDVEYVSIWTAFQNNGASASYVSVFDPHVPSPVLTKDASNEAYCYYLRIIWFNDHGFNC
jgi:hypothetical protein